ncbi:DUF2339 domain-containing protein [Mycolicibacterium sphagni]|uniref:DUF2339 domain-containing protein n=1 Tax=Mycolicibacterium sphagni TaxID=1786 RepID=A0ABX2K1D9_9MYCO|nr:DUF2339 domain-containing protein [Mycolicibacterium sphagni]NTY62967.1 DUF2339 domain-containing protein [Mycolicibacterium sphagni]
MNDPQRAVLAQLSHEFAAMSAQMARISATLNQLDLNAPVAQQQYWQPQPPPYYPPPPPPPVVAPATAGDPDRGWIGKALAVAGVGVTLIGVVLLLVLAAQAGLLRPELRVAAGGVLGAVLVGIGIRLHARPGGQVGAIALSATGIAALYMDVMAVTTIYHWVAAPVALVIGALVGGGGLSLARRWGSEQLAVLVLVPLVILAPVITNGVTLLLIGFMIALSAAALLVQIGRDWLWMHTARTAAVTLPLMVALVAAYFGSSVDGWLLGAATGVAALLAVTSALVLLPSSANRAAMAIVTVGGLVPVLAAGIAVDQWLAALLAAAVSVCLLAIVLLADRLPGVAGVVTQVWSAASAAAALVAITVAFDGEVAAPLLLAIGAVVAVAGRRALVARWAATGLGFVGAVVFFVYAPDILVDGWRLTVSSAASTLAGSAVLVAWAGTVAWAHRTGWVAAALVSVYGLTVFTVTAGVLIGGPEKGFLAGHMAATICWIGLAAGLFAAALRTRRPELRAAPIAGGLVLTSAAMAKLFLFDLGTLDGIFRVVAFIVVGLVLLAMGTGYARSLAARRDESDSESRQESPLAPC